MKFRICTRNKNRGIRGVEEVDRTLNPTGAFPKDSKMGFDCNICDSMPSLLSPLLLRLVRCDCVAKYPMIILVVTVFPDPLSPDTKID
jgi:hypothetical protein